MTKTLAVIAAVTGLTAVLLAGPAQDPPQPDPALVARATDLVDRLVSGDVEPLSDQFTPQMKAAIDAGRLRAMIPALARQLGPFTRRTGVRADSRGVMRDILVRCVFEHGEADVRVAFNPQGQIGGLGILPPAPAAAAYAPPDYSRPSMFRTEEVTVDAGGWPLPGTIVVPLGASGGALVPGIVLVHGSGPNDRDESIGANKPFRDLAEGLASRGIAVLRYDKRTLVHAARVAQQTDATVKDEVIDDAVAAVELLRKTPGVRADRVFVIGHSLGGMLAPRIAAADTNIAGLIVMAGATRPLEDAIAAQIQYLAGLDGTISPQERRQIDEAETLRSSVRALKPGDPLIDSPLARVPTSYWLDLRGYDPPAAAAALHSPMLVLQGERDYQVTMDEFARWRAALGSRDDVTFKSYPALNHLFIAGTGRGSPAEYSTPGHVAREVIDDIASWIAGQ